MKNDLELQQDIINELNWQPFIDSSKIGVKVQNGVVNLFGEVPSYAQKIAAEKAVKKVTGVKAIAEDLEIRLITAHQKTDIELATSVLNALKWHSAVPEDKIQIKVEDGLVTLEGEVEWDYQRSSAKNAIANLSGVKGVNNLITLKTKVTEFDVKKLISNALHRTATIDAERISVDMVGNKVILKGSVSSYTEKEDVEEAAWCAPGVVTVESHLMVEPQMELAF